jgi:hypothetical protein
MSEVKTTNYYYVENIKVSEDVAKMYWKRLHKDYDNFYNTLIGEKAHPEMQMFGEQIKQEWETIPHLTVQKAFEEKNIEVRRLYFRAIGVAEMFQELEPTLIDKQVLEKEGITWDNDNKEITTHMRDEYELYEIQGAKLFPEESSSWRTANATVFAVRCWCSTTGREYWIYVPRNIGQKGDALEAIAWTVQLNITNPEYIYRQGDVILAKYSASSQECRPYHLEAKDYVKLLKAES